MRNGRLAMHRADAKAFFPHLQQNLRKLLSRRLPNDAFHLQVKKGSENLAGIQSSRFNEVVNMHRSVVTQKLVTPFLCVD
jgi:hypothetical protein